MRHQRARHWVLLACSLGWGMGAWAQSPAPTDAVVKAGFVYNFAKFTEWPAGALPAGHIVLCLIGLDAQGAVSTAIEGRPLQGRTLSVQRNPRNDELKNCQIVYLSDVDERRQSEVLRVVRGQPVLTVGDADGFAEVGGVIGLIAASGRMQFEINNEVAQAAGLKISSQLLRLARSVRGRTP